MSHRNDAIRITTLAGIAILAGCGGGGETAGPTPGNAVATVTVSPGTITLAPQQTTTLSAVVKDANGAVLTNRVVTWTSSASQRASVSGTGLVTALTPGTATITATSEGRSGSATVTIEAPPVASVTVSPASAALVPQQTIQLAAETRDAGGAALTGRDVTWTTSQNTVATVSGAGLVTAVAPGTATITAASEGKSGTAQVTVAAGAVVGSTGGTITADNGNVVITVPSGAVNSATAITVATVAQPAVALPANAQQIGPVYRLGPAGLSFSQPVTVKLKYDRNTLPAWAMSGDLSVQRLTGSQWGSLTDIVVDGQANTVTGKLTGFATSGVAARMVAGSGAVALPTAEDGSDLTTQALNPHAILTPASGSVNFQKRSVNFRVSLEPRGEAIPAGPVTQPIDNPKLYKYRWSTTGQNGSLGAGGTTTGWTTQPEMQYIATNPVLNQLSGQIDQITVEVLLNPAAEANPTPRDIASQTAGIDADLKFSYDMLPDGKTIGRGEVANFQFRIRDQSGNVINLPDRHEIEWSSSANFGDIPDPFTLQPTQTTIAYTAHQTFSGPTPRIDDVTARLNRLESVTERVPVWGGLLGLQLLETRTETNDYPIEVTKVKVLVTVKVDYQVKFLPATSTLPPGGTKQLEATIEPANEIPAANLAYRYINSANQGTLNVANNAQTTSNKVTYTAKNVPSGGTDQVQVEVLSIVAGTVLETIGTKTVSVEVDPWATATFSIYTEPTPAHPEGFVAARICIPKIQGASSYVVEAASTPDGPYNKTFGGAETANTRSVNQVIDGGSAWCINVAAGFSSTQVGVDGRKTAYQNGYGSVLYKYKALP